MFSWQARSSRREPFDPARVTEQDHFQEQLGRVGGTADLVLGVEFLEPGVGHPFFDQVMERVLDAPFGQLGFELERHHQILPIIIRLESRHEFA
jgi:hypothetical protein